MRAVRPSLTGFASRPGMTLIEVLLALAIMLMALAAILQLNNFGADNALQASLEADGTRLAQSKLAEVESGSISPTSSASGTCDSDDSGWTWTVSSSLSTIPNLYTVTVTVTHDFRGQPLNITLSQLIFDTAYQGTAAMVPNPVTGTTTSGTVAASSSSSGSTTTGSTSP